MIKIISESDQKPFKTGSNSLDRETKIVGRMKPGRRAWYKKLAYFWVSSSVAELRIEECYLRNHKWGYEDSDTVGQLSTRCLKGQVLYFATQISTSSRERQHLWLGALYNLICLCIMINLVTCHPILFLKKKI